MSVENKLDIIRPFGPSIGMTNIPKLIIDKINNFIDEVVKDKNKLKQLQNPKLLRLKSHM